MKLPPEEYYKSLPRKYIGAGVLFLNDNEEILLVKPTYKKKWELPGGIVEADESPQEACTREIKEELGLDIAVKSVLSFDYTKRSGFKGDTIQFVFFGGILSNEEISKIKLQGEELSQFDFFSPSALPEISPRMAIRIPRALESIKNGKTIYYEIDANLF